MLAALGLASTAVPVAAPAAAHGAPYTVTAGNAAAGAGVPVTLTSGTFVFRDTTTNQVVSCTSVTLRGTVVVGSNAGRIGTVDAPRSAFTNCTGPAGLKFTITGFGVWFIDVTDSTSGVSSFTIGNVRAHLMTNAGPTCAWDFAAPSGSFTSSGTATTAPGALQGAYTNSSKQLAVPASNPGSLGLWNVHGSGTTTYCISPSVWKQGDRMSWSATWTLAADVAADNPVAIT